MTQTEKSNAVIKDLTGKVCKGCDRYADGKCNIKDDYCFTAQKLERHKKILEGKK
jgi:hypothetical protein